MKVYGDNTNYPFGKDLHDNNFPLEISSLCSISVLGFHSVWTTKEGRAFAFGYNGDFRISETLPNGIFGKEREIVIKDKSMQIYLSGLWLVLHSLSCFDQNG